MSRFRVPEGKIFGFLGPNGAGKTTTIKMLTTVLEPTSGEIRVNGLDPATPAKRRCGVRFGIVFQDPSLDDELTALRKYGAARRALRRCRAPSGSERIESLLKLRRALGPPERLRESIFPAA